MPCYHPIKGYRSVEVGESGKRGIVFSPVMGFIDMPLEVPCGQCIGCRLERSRQWAIRCVHEASMWEENSFITLTYNDANIPKNGSLDMRHFQLFMKRLRRLYPKRKIRFFHCGEYGEKYKRPHYHACLFNFDFQDKKIHSEGKNKLYRSEILEKLWPYGFALIGEVTFESAAYVARYITKKVTGKNAEEHYGDLKPEYVTMSRGGRGQDGKNLGGIGKGWFDKYKDDLYPSDFIIVDGKKMKPPKYYDRNFEKIEEAEFKKLKNERIKKGVRFEKDNTPERLGVRKKIQVRKMDQLTRLYEREE